MLDPGPVSEKIFSVTEKILLIAQMLFSEPDKNVGEPETIISVLTTMFSTPKKIVISASKFIFVGEKTFSFTNLIFERSCTNGKAR